MIGALLCATSAQAQLVPSNPVNPTPGSLWMYFGPTLGSDWSAIFAPILSLTPNSVLFEGNSMITQDSTNFVWDPVNRRLGLGTATPQTTFDIPDNAGVGTPVLVGAKGLTSLTNWLESSIPFTVKQSEITGLSTIGGYGVIGGTKMSMNPSSVGGFGVGGFSISDGTATQPAFGVFGYTVAPGPAIAQANEFDIINLGGPNPQVTPYSIPVPLTISTWVSSGDPSYPPVSFTGSISGTTLSVSAVSVGTFHTYDVISGAGISANTWITGCLTGTCVGTNPALWTTGTYSLNKSFTVTSEAMTVTPLDASVGLGIINNTTKFKTGLFFQSNALTGGTGIDGDTIIRDAISLPRLAGINFWNSSDTTTPSNSIYSFVQSGVLNKANIRFDNLGVQIESNAGFATSGKPLILFSPSVFDAFWQVGNTTAAVSLAASSVGAANVTAYYNVKGTGGSHIFQVGGAASLTIDTSGILSTTIPTSAGAGGVYLCIDSSGRVYKKAACP